MTSQPPSYRGDQFPSEIISHAFWLYHRFDLGFRDVEDLLAEQRITVKYEAIRQWCRTFGLNYARRLRHRRGRQGDTWHLHELFIKIRGRQQYLWRAMDEDRDMLDTLVQPRRNRRGAKAGLPQAVEQTRFRAEPAGHGQAAHLLGGAPQRDTVHGPQYSAVRQQTSGDLASTDSSAPVADAGIQVGRSSATVRVGARRCPESVQGRPPPAPGGSLPSLENPPVLSLG